MDPLVRIRRIRQRSPYEKDFLHRVDAGKVAKLQPRAANMPSNSFSAFLLLGCRGPRFPFHIRRSFAELFLRFLFYIRRLELFQLL